MPARRPAALALIAVAALAPVGRPAEPAAKPPAVALEQPPADPNAAKVVLIGGSNRFRPGEHEYLAGCRVLADLLRQTPGVAPVLAADWPTKPETLAGAKAVVLFLDGGDKHPLLNGDRLDQVRKLADTGGGVVQLHQIADYPKDFSDRAVDLAGGVWQKDRGQRAHWVAAFDGFPDHPVFRGVTPFKIDDGWLFKNRFADDKGAVVPLLRTANPKATGKLSDAETVVAWAYTRPAGGRAVTFTGGHLHASFAEEGYRRFLTNAVLWAAGVDVPAGGAAVQLDPAELPKYLPAPPPKK